MWRGGRKKIKGEKTREKDVVNTRQVISCSLEGCITAE